MLALLDSDVVRTILLQYRISPEDLRRQLEQEAPKGEAGDDEGGREIGVTPRGKSALGRAFTASHELGHSYVGPEHFLIVLAQEAAGIAGDPLRRLGPTAQGLRPQVIK